MTDKHESLPQLREPDGDGYLYDFFKYMTSLSLLSLGALFTFIEMKNATGVPTLLFAAAVVPLGMTALLSFYGAKQLVSAKAAGRALSAEVYWYGKAAPFVYLVGIVILAYICGDIIR